MDQTPSPQLQSSAPSQGSQSLKFDLVRFLNQLPGWSISLYALHLLDGWFRSLPSGDQLRRQCLWALLIIAAPATVLSGWSLLRRYLADRSSNKPPS